MRQQAANWNLRQMDIIHGTSYSFMGFIDLNFLSIFFHLQHSLNGTEAKDVLGIYSAIAAEWNANSQNTKFMTAAKWVPIDPRLFEEI